MTIIICRTCNKEFRISPSRIGKKKYCSKRCLALSQRKGVDKECQRCYKSFYARPSKKQKFCSEYCQHKGQVIHNRGVLGYKNDGTYVTGHDALKGEENPNWQGGITPENIKRRNALRNNFRTWARLVKERDSQCVWCGNKDELEADHILPVKYYPEMAKALSNGRALCIPCHQLKTSMDRRHYV